MTQISAINNNYPTVNTEKPNTTSIIQKIALATLQEIGVCALCIAITAPFVATPVGIATLAIAGIAIVAINTLIRAAGGYFYLQYQRTKDPVYSTGLTICQYFAPATFSILDNTTRDMLVHEAGHAMAASLLYKDANPTIAIMPFKGGITHYHPRELSGLGKFFGPKNSDLIVAAAGAGASISLSALSIAAAHYLKKSYPALSRYLIATAIMSIASHIIYALGAFAASRANHSHDFVALWAGGIHPIVSCAYMIGLPLITKAALLAIDYLAIKFFISPNASDFSLNCSGSVVNP